MTTEIWRLSAVDMALQIKNREFSCLEATESCLARIDAVNPRINALAEVLHEQAIAAAKDADIAVARGDTLGALHGVPVTTKINVDQIGCATTQGVTAFKAVVAEVDSPPVASLRKAGAIIVGRSNAPAFSYRFFTDNDVHGRTLNPYDPLRTPGGSSGGAAAALAMGMGAIAHGNDLGGSIRHPAYACGVVGIRPSLGRVPAYNPTQTKDRTLAIQLSSMQGPLARTIADLRVALTAMSTPDNRDVWSTPVPLNFDTPAQRPRVAVCASIPGLRTDPGVVAAVKQAAVWLEEAGYQVEEAVPPRINEARELWIALACNEARSGLLGTMEKYGDKAIKHVIKNFMALAPELDLIQYMDALGLRTTLLREWTAFFDRYPLLLMPTSLEMPFIIDRDQSTVEETDAIHKAQTPLLATAILGLPGLSVPTGLFGGVPTGVQLVAGRFQEALCLAAGEEVERRAHWCPLVNANA
ncbi:MAG TPA: amidase family protein [Pseudomonas sp.]|nr:amidase family protein [Pseudomonas sp.]